MTDSVDLSQYVKNTLDFKVFLAPNTSDEDIVVRSKSALSSCGIPIDRVQINYDMQLLETGDLYASFEPPDLVVRLVYEKKVSGIVKMKSVAVLKI